MWSVTELFASQADATVPVEVLDASAEDLPFPDDTFDTVVCTLVLCTFGDQAQALTEMRRVLRPGGTLVFFEHVRGRGPAGYAQKEEVGDLRNQAERAPRSATP